MALYQIAWNSTTKTATVDADGAALPGGSTKIGTFNHLNDPADQRGWEVNHVIWHHIRHALYPLGEWNMQAVTLVAPSKLIGVQEVTVQEQVDSITVDDKLQLQWEVFPLNADTRTVTFTSSVPGVATVTNTGVVTGVSVGKTEITVTSTEGAKTAIAYVNVVA